MSVCISPRPTPFRRTNLGWGAPILPPRPMSSETEEEPESEYSEPQVESATTFSEFELLEEGDEEEGAEDDAVTTAADEAADEADIIVTMLLPPTASRTTKHLVIMKRSVEGRWGMEEDAVLMLLKSGVDEVDLQEAEKKTFFNVERNL
jgi:hypothetical protein